MIYRLLKFLFSFAVRGYFRSITIRNPELVPETGAVIFVANHTSSFMDPIVIAIEIQRVLHFLARGEIFKKPLISAILSKLNMIPIYRPKIEPDKIFHNKEIFQKCYDYLSEGKCIIIFPEGNSKTERRLRKIKTGTARIALGAEIHNKFNLGLSIIPIGINYSNPHIFRSDLFLNIGNPIKVADYKKAYKQDDFAAALKLTKNIKTELEKRTVIVREKEIDKLILNIEKIYRGQLTKTVEQDAEKNIKDFYMSKEIVNAVTYFYKSDKKRVLREQKKIRRYLSKIKELKLRDTQMRGSGMKQKYILKLLFLILTFPMFLFGYINNYIPFKIAETLSRKLVNRDDFLGSLQIALGLLSFLVFYILQTLLVLHFFNVGIAVLYLLLLYPTGLFALKYFREYYRVKNRIRLIRLLLNKGELMTKLAIERKEIIDALEKGKEEYLQG